MILTSEGAPQAATGGRVRLGTQQPDALLGITNTFSYKNFNLGFLFDARFGGKVFSATNAILQASGVAAATVRNGEREAFVVDGVIADGAGGYTQNTKAIIPQRYWDAVAGLNNLGITEANLYDATSVRLRNVQLSYTLPKRIWVKHLSRTPGLVLAATTFG